LVYSHGRSEKTLDHPHIPAAARQSKILVWDVPTRLFHWVVVALVVAAYVTWRLNAMDWHAKCGYALLTAVVFRILWGFFGSETAEFLHFLTSPIAAARYLALTLHREPDRQVGHNPAGGWMVLLLLFLLLVETLTGIYVANDVADEGRFSELVPAPIANLITALHSIVWDALVAAVGLHILAIGLYAVVKGQNLLRPMITPRCGPPPKNTAISFAIRSTWQALNESKKPLISGNIGHRHEQQPGHRAVDMRRVIDALPLLPRKVPIVGKISDRKYGSRNGNRNWKNIERLRREIDDGGKQYGRNRPGRSQ